MPRRRKSKPRRVERVKAVTSDALDDGGRKNPSRPSKFKSDLIPDNGLIVSPLPMAQAMIEGKKTLMVKTQPMDDLANGKFVLVSARKAIGVVELGSMATFNLDQFKELEKRHLIGEHMRQKWGKQYKGWREGPFFAWTVKVVTKFDEPRETNVGPGTQTLAKDVVVKMDGVSVAKIKDVNTYDPSKVSDQVLRDDFRIVLAWYANLQSDSNFKHGLKTIEELLRKILKEAAIRGPKVIVFRPSGMASSVRGFFNRVASEVKLPQNQVTKSELPEPHMIEYSATDELVQAHWELHKMHGVEGIDSDMVANTHSMVVDELYGRGHRHPAPPDCGLDEFSVDFQKHADAQPDWYSEPWLRKPVEVEKAHHDKDEDEKKAGSGDVPPPTDNFLTSVSELRSYVRGKRKSATKGDVEGEPAQV